jgi:hypothetical protein
VSPPTVDDVWPPVGTEVTVSSTRRDKDATGSVVACNDRGIRVRLGTGRTRFYPWAQVAFVEWGA